MNTKTTKRRQKRLNTNDTDDTDLTDKSSEKAPTKKLEESSDSLVIVEDEPPSKPAEENGKASESEENACRGFENGESSEKNGEHKEEIKNGEAEPESIDVTLRHEEELEPLIVIDSDADKSAESNAESHATEKEDSPVIVNRITRRQAKMSPAPKSDVNGDSKIENDIRINVVRYEDIPEENESAEFQETETEKAEDKHNGENEIDVTNASIIVNLGNDTTKNVDFTNVSIAEEVVSNSFIELTKDVSYGEALRGISGRRMLRGSRDSPYTRKDATDGSRKSYVPHISSVKRKGQHESPEDSKRFKNDESPGLLSYFSSPLASFRNKVSSRQEIPSSTPKLTGFKFSHPTGIMDDVSKIDLEEKVEPKKWCSIM